MAVDVAGGAAGSTIDCDVVVAGAGVDRRPGSGGRAKNLELIAARTVVDDQPCQARVGQ